MSEGVVVTADQGAELPAKPSLMARAVSVVTPCVVLAIAAAFGILLYADRTIPENEWIRGVAGVVFALLVAPMGSLLLRRVPGNPLGWIFSALAIGAGAIEPLAFLAIHGALVNHDTFGWTIFSAWITEPLAVASVGTLVAVVPLAFPDGRVSSTRWRRYARVVVAFLVLATIAVGIQTLPLHTGAGRVDSTGSLARSGAVSVALAFLGILLFSIVSVANLVARYRRASGARRRQLGGFALAEVVVIAVGFVPHAVSNALLPPGDLLISLTNAIFIGTFSLLLVAMAIAILRYRLYGIQVLVNRALVYGLLAGSITAVYVGIAVGIGTLVGSGGKPNIGLSILATGIVAVGFQPLRERLQRIANRLVYGKRATPYEVLSQFSERVAESYASDDVLPRMARVLAEGTSADLAEVWLRSGDALHRAAVFPLQASAPAAVHLNGTAELSIPSADRSVVVRHQGEVLGALTLTKRRGEAITPIEVKLMDDLANQAGLVLKNVGLTADLQARLVDLRASRQRLVAAQDDERRKLERNLHDGAQQYLVAIKVKLGLAEMLVTRDPAKARAAVAELKHDADEALETLRDLARGIYPPLLADKGLAIALQAQARKATLPVTVDADGIGRYPQDTEAALYFCILEALQNIQKYAQASSATVSVGEDQGQLCVEVADDGCGFDVGTTIRGNGLTNMEDRLDALGGMLHIASSPGNGTTLRAAVPVVQVLSVKS
jgi:signal transduction histidine kinase